MSEKKGHTVKLKFPFPEHRCCEVYVTGLERYHRVTPNEFRSWVGKRRILNVDTPDHSFYEDYEGPVFLYGTNKIVNVKDYKEGVVFVDGKDPREGKKRRHGETGIV
jgi:hypothetical protein